MYRNKAKLNPKSAVRRIWHGDRETSRYTLDQLVDLRDNIRSSKVEVRILPLSAPVVLALENSFILLDLDDKDVVLYRENSLSDSLVDSAEAIAMHQALFKQMLNRALSTDASRRLIEARIAVLASALDRA